MTRYQWNPDSGFWSRPEFSGIAYSDGEDFERSLLEVLRNTSDKSVFSSTLLRAATDWRGEYHLTPQRHCLLRPLPLAPGQSVLELGCGCGAITRYLGEQGLAVTAIEGGASRAAIAAERCRDLDNVRVVLEDLVQFEAEDRFDWVTLIGVLEYAPMFAPGPDPVLAYLEQALKYVKPDGHLVVAIENKLGLKYFSGCGEDHVGKPFYGVNGLYDGSWVVTFGRAELEERLRSAGFGSVEFYYPFPDYKLPSAIVADQAFGHAGFHVADLLLRIDSRDYSGRLNRVFSEQLVARSLDDNGVLRDFANSFLVVASPQPHVELTDSTPLAWTYSLGRRNGFRTETVFQQSETGNVVHVDKRPIGPSAEPSNVDADLTHHCGRTSYVQGRLMVWEVLKAKLHPNPKDALIKAFMPYGKYLLSLSHCADGAPAEQIESWWIAGRHIDCTPFNLIQADNGLVAIDQEWEIRQNVPTGWVLLRAMVQSLAQGAHPHRLSSLTIGELLTGLGQELGLRISADSPKQWQELEQFFLEAATGIPIRVPPLSTPISALNRLRILDIDRPAAEPEEPGLDDPWHSGYKQWMLARQQNIANSNNVCSRGLSESAPSFHLVIRHAGNEMAGLADSIENLKHLQYDLWFLDVVSTLPPPDRIDTLSCLNWHHVSNDQTKEVIDLLATNRKLDWIVELPPGAVLDPLCLWRLRQEIQGNPDAIAFFVDDDVFDQEGNRMAPRFKPGVNREWLMSSDLAGPLFIQRDAWSASGGASENRGSPWFDQLLRIAATFGLDHCAHVPDVLISYREAFPSERDSCLQSLSRYLRHGWAEREIVSTTNRSWCIRTPNPDTPLVSIAVLSKGQVDMLSRCLTPMLAQTEYPNFEVILSVTDTGCDPELRTWLEGVENRFSTPIKIVMTAVEGNQATRCNNAVAVANGELIALVREEVAILQGRWLHELVQITMDESVGAVAPRIVNPAGRKVHDAGGVLGMPGSVGTPYQDEADLTEPGYLDYLWVCRETASLSATCLLVRTEAYRSVGGMDETSLGDWLADADLCQRIRESGLRLLYQPLSAVSYRSDSTVLDPTWSSRTHRVIERERAEACFVSRWLKPGWRDPFWNPNLSLTDGKPTLQVDYQCQWLTQPYSNVPRILARGLTNGQANFRILDPLRALCRKGRASACIWPQTEDRPQPTSSDLARLEPDSIIVQNYMNNSCLAALESWQKFAGRPFIVFALDDLITDLDASNPFRREFFANGRARLSYALKRCDRMVVSTEYLAEAYHHFIGDIRIVPNRLDSEIWLPLASERQCGGRPRIGWAGGVTHQEDLLLLKEVIEQTREEADWVFFGMCPDEIRPLLAEYHSLVPFTDYPAYLASLNLDIAVAPLADTPFNHAKSNLRLLEYGMLGIPVVCTDITPYRNSPACRVPNHPARWIEAIRARVYDADARVREGRALRRWVREHFLLDGSQDDWLDAHLPDGWAKPIQ